MEIVTGILANRALFDSSPSSGSNTVDMNPEESQIYAFLPNEVQALADQGAGQRVGADDLELSWRQGPAFNFTKSICFAWKFQTPALKNGGGELEWTNQVMGLKTRVLDPLSNSPVFRHD